MARTIVSPRKLSSGWPPPWSAGWFWRWSPSIAWEKEARRRRQDDLDFQNCWTAAASTYSTLMHAVPVLCVSAVIFSPEGAEAPSTLIRK